MDMKRKASDSGSQAINSSNNFWLASLRSTAHIWRMLRLAVLMQSSTVISSKCELRGEELGCQSDARVKPEQVKEPVISDSNFCVNYIWCFCQLPASVCLLPSQQPKSQLIKSRMCSIMALLT